MKTLYILRHAKSDWTNGDLTDFDRPLNERGRKAAPLMGDVMRTNQFVPDLILSSPAERARQTAALVKDAAQFDAKTHFDERIYEATPVRLIEILEEQHDEYDSILIIGHNPGFEGLVRFLTAKIEPLPTAALAVVDLPIESWSKLNGAKGDLRVLIRPKEVKTEN